MKGVPMHRTILRSVLLLALLLPASTAAQSGDASWLESLDGLETGIGRAWMGEITFSETYTETEYNDQGTPVHEISMLTEDAATPEVTDQHRTMMLSVFVFQFDTEENAAAGLEKLNDEQIAQHRRDPRSPAVNEFETDLGDASHGWQGELELPTIDNTGNLKLSVVYLMVQDGDLVYQLSGQFLPGYGEDISRGVIADMIAAETGEKEPVFEPNGGSTGGLWEKLNVVDVPFPDGMMTFDLQIWPMDPNAVQGQSVIMPQVDLNALDQLPGITQGWYASYGEDDLDPDSTPEGVFSVEVWVLEFDTIDNAMATAFAIQDPLLAPLGIIGGESAGATGEREEVTLYMNGTGFVRDRSLPEGDAAYIIVVEETTVYVVRVYANGPAPLAVGRDVIDHALQTPVGESAQDDATATGGGWDRLPGSGTDLVHSLELRDHQYITPGPATPSASPVG